MSDVGLNNLLGPGGLSAAASRVANSLGRAPAGQSPAASRVAQAAAGGIAARAAAASGSTGAAATGTAITSTDFLSLLVTEMKNQDPTQPTDPNAYIQQLVGVNSLQQLIAINGDLNPPVPPAATGQSGQTSGSAITTNPVSRS